MKLLLCIGGGEMSRDTIIAGGKIAAAFNTDLSVLYVGEKHATHMTSAVNMSRMKLSEWKIELPGVKVLEYAEMVLHELNLLEVDDTGEIVEVHSLKPDINGAYELHAMGKHGQNIRLRLREGEIIDEVIKEVDVGGYDVTIIGASRPVPLPDALREKFLHVKLRTSTDPERGVKTLQQMGHEKPTPADLRKVIKKLFDASSSAPVPTLSEEQEQRIRASFPDTAPQLAALAKGIAALQGQDQVEEQDIQDALRVGKDTKGDEK